MIPVAGDGQVRNYRAPILVIEDDFEFREVLRELFCLEGYEVLTAVDGADAMRQLQQGARPGLILLDLIMPGIDGFQFRESQKLYPELAEIPVIVISGMGGLEALNSTLGCQDVMRKPLELDVILSTVRHYCGEGWPNVPGN